MGIIYTSYSKTTAQFRLILKSIKDLFLIEHYAIRLDGGSMVCIHQHLLNVSGV